MTCAAVSLPPEAPTFADGVAWNEGAGPVSDLRDVGGLPLAGHDRGGNGAGEQSARRRHRPSASRVPGRSRSPRAAGLGRRGWAPGEAQARCCRRRCSSTGMPFGIPVAPTRPRLRHRQRARPATPRPLEQHVDAARGPPRHDVRAILMRGAATIPRSGTPRAGSSAADTACAAREQRVIQHPELLERGVGVDVIR
jgi:hypothetical protein